MALGERNLKIAYLNNVPKNSESERPYSGIDAAYPASSPVDGFSESNLFCYYQNIRSVVNKKDTFFLAALHCHYDLILLSETWLRPSIASSEFIDLSVFHMVRHDRARRTGGGVLIAIRNTLKFRGIDFGPGRADFPDIALAGVFIASVVDPSIFIIVVYIPPSTSLVVYEDFLDFLIEKFELLGDQVIISGDFNVPRLDSSDSRPHDRRVLLIGSFRDFLQLLQRNHIVNCMGYSLDLVLS